MSDTFTASNGKRVSTESEEGAVRVGDMPLTSREVVALREFFQHERDKELGRWRWPERTNLVVYPLEVAGHTDAAYRECAVVDEVTGSHQEFGSDLPRCHGGPFREAARAYFAAHPEPKPWHGAKPGEVWEMGFSNGQNMIGLVTSDGDCFIGAGQEKTVIVSTAFTAGRRIWPEVKP